MSSSRLSGSTVTIAFSASSRKEPCACTPGSLKSHRASYSRTNLTKNNSCRLLRFCLLHLAQLDRIERRFSRRTAELAHDLHFADRIIDREFRGDVFPVGRP